MFLVILLDVQKCLNMYIKEMMTAKTVHMTKPPILEKIVVVPSVKPSLLLKVTTLEKLVV